MLDITAPATRPAKTLQATRISLSEVQLTSEFKHALELLQNTNKHLFITGKAGTGKSTLLRYFRETTRKRIAVVAPTGIAAINVEGQTVHSFLRLPPRFLEKNDVRMAGKNRVTIQKLDALIIDEVSMVRADLMDAIDWSLRINRGRMDEPFGGVQMVFFGDLYQLPPVVDEELQQVFEQRYESPFFFSASVFKSIDLDYIELIRIFRQTDEAFVALLIRVRDNNCTAEDIQELNRRVINDNAEQGSAVILTTTNHGAAEINEQKLNQLESGPFEYEASISGKFDDSFPTDRKLVLKRGAQVILLKNDQGKRWVNGTIAHIADLSKDSISIAIGDRTYYLQRERWEKSQYQWKAETDTIERETVGAFEQFPLKLAWAITIHKSQGQTLTDVVIDVETGAFAHGQLYVALSRCTSLSGIRLRTPIQFSDIIFDHRVMEFKNKFHKPVVLGASEV